MNRGKIQNIYNIKHKNLNGEKKKKQLRPRKRRV